MSWAAKIKLASCFMQMSDYSHRTSEKKQAFQIKGFYNFFPEALATGSEGKL